MKELSKTFLSGAGWQKLLILGWALLIFVPVSAAISSTRSAAQFGSSPSPVTTPQPQTEERRNPVRRFFSWVAETVRRPFRKQVPPIYDPPFVNITSSTSSINYCPPTMRSLNNCSASRELELYASAGGPDTKRLYGWTVSAGRIRGEGQKVIWDLGGVADGTYTATVEMDDGSGHIASASTQVTVTLCHSCVTLESPCPTVMVSCPGNAKSSQSMSFEAHVYGGDATVTSTYTWAVSAGKITNGQGTPVITVDVSDVTRGSITATVSIGGLEPGCANTARCTTRTAGEVGKAGCEPL